jgi:hypothetical protein
MPTKEDNDLVIKIAKRIIMSMAYNREVFKDKVEEHVGGALLEFYKASLAKKNIGRDPWIDHWLKEVRQLLDVNLVIALKHGIKGFKDRKKALNEVIGRLQAKDLSYRKSAELIIKKDYKIRDLTKGLDNRDTVTFWKRVQDAIEVGLVE